MHFKMRSALVALLISVAIMPAVADRTVQCGGKSFTLPEPEADAMEFLYTSMPLSDVTMYSPQFFLDNARIALRARQELPWGESVPQDIWQYFVLPVRANNEYLDNFRTTYYDELKNRVKGMDMATAALEVNHWLHEKATYQPADARTSAPCATVKTAYGRCGEESTLGVAAFRAVGIPARQVYTPRWAHTDDNHAWVEVWVDGRWHFLGACEPEPELDRAWFNAPASRGILMHTNVFGDYPGPEQILSHVGNITKINVTENYVPVRESRVTVVDEKGQPVPDVWVRFDIYNYGEFYTAVKLLTDAGGETMLKTGIGDMLAWASDGKKFGFAKISGPQTQVLLNHKIGETFECDIDIVPPVENPIPSHANEADIARNKARFEAENGIRALYTDTFFGERLCPVNADSIATIFGKDKAEVVIPYLKKAKGNWRDILGFISEAPTDRFDEAVAILENISEKDLRDTPQNVLTATLLATPPYDPTSGIKRENYVAYILNPRISNELLSDYRQTVSVKGLNARQIIDMVRRDVDILDNSNSYGVPLTPDAVWRTHNADSHSRDIYFIALCRAAGIPAEIDPVTGACQYHDGNVWINVDFAQAEEKEAATGTVRATYQPTTYLANPEYYRHFTISAIEDGVPRVLEFGEDMGENYKSILEQGSPLPQGYYMLCTGTRQASGAVNAHLVFFNINKDETTTVPLVMRHSSQGVEVIGAIDAEAKYLPFEAQQPSSILSTTGRGYFLIGILGETDEPSNHAAQELASLDETLKQWGRPMLLLGRKRANLVGLPNTSWGTDADGNIRKMLSSVFPVTADQEQPNLPIILLADSFGRVVFASHGYDTSLAQKLRSVISQL